MFVGFVTNTRYVHMYYLNIIQSSGINRVYTVYPIVSSWYKGMNVMWETEQ